MKLIYWDDKFSVKVAKIDQQHKELFEIINNLNELVDVPGMGEYANIVIKQLADYAQNHFVTEEKYFKDFNYPDSAVHLIAHNGYRNKIKDLTDQYSKSGTLDLKNIRQFLIEWWISHITQMDQKYVQCFIQHGLH